MTSSARSAVLGRVRQLQPWRARGCVENYTGYDYDYDCDCHYFCSYFYFYYCHY